MIFYFSGTGNSLYAAKKIAEEKLKNINQIINKRQSGVFNIFPGTFAALKSAVVTPLFNKFAMNTKRFYATDTCTSCRICERVCPIHTIAVKGKPVWNKVCTQCMACINSCPVKAIQYGKGTVRKGRYLHPDLKAGL